SGEIYKLGTLGDSSAESSYPYDPGKSGGVGYPVHRVRTELLSVREGYSKAGNSPIEEDLPRSRCFGNFVDIRYGRHSYAADGRGHRREGTRARSRTSAESEAGNTLSRENSQCAPVRSRTTCQPAPSRSDHIHIS
ncbi:MAG: hypothetical protein M1823_008707, partial [Watsoniomyces obsoletus]